MALTPSQRIGLIKEVSRRMESEEYSLIDVTLRQFSLPWSDQWSGTKFDYLVAMIDKAPDSTLVELAKHTGYTAHSASPQVVPKFWQPASLRVFLSHLSEHRETAGNIKDAARAYGMSCFVAHSDIEPTQEWLSEIEAALATCDALVAVLHPGFHLSKWTDQEIGYAMGRGIPVFSVRYGQDPHGFIGRFQAFSGINKSADGLARRTV